MIRQFTIALASLAVLCAADQSFDQLAINDAASDIAAETDTTPIIDLSELEYSNLSQLQQSGFPMKVGDSKQFSIRGNPTTGYTWNLHEDDVADGAISVEKSYRVDDAPEGWTGVPGTYYFTVTANAAGEGNLDIWHGRVWESEANSENTIKIPIHVHN